ncbi:multiheme c-type cytochrome [Dethiobacter alkaliphilus]|uniref:Cytochrome c-552/4 domain-containing protein n=1 Tax=Dethiobacter alkaliphilus AHT 1 TaxID=555088 RepID=C0GF28_DETAL|nr:multiheme c-type cytochrome [Dethiobacter alkaliphilus]EEG78210.1 hypothetical protein DealDRAFT_1087 [Dethiobacter alkaliphilus AHT 1]
MKRKRWMTLGIFLLTLVMVFSITGCGDTPANEENNNNENVNGENGEEVPEETSDIPEYGNYVGSDACQGCHSAEYEAWQGTWHSVSMQTPDMLYDDIFNGNLEDGITWNDLSEGLGNPIMIDEDEPSGIAGTKDFVVQGTEVNDVDGVYIYHLGDREFEARFTAEDGEILHTVDVEVFGHGNKRRATNFTNIYDGGGNYLLKYQVRYDRDGGNWSQTLDGEPTGGVWADRNDVRRWDDNCGGCHATGLNVPANLENPDLIATELVADMAVGCEACHGPGGDHAADPMNEDLIVSFSDMTTKQQNDACEQCHTRTTANKHFDPEVRWGDAYGFLPGDNLEDHVEFILPTWGEEWRRVSADGKGRGWHQWGFDLQLGPKADWACIDCHSVHGANDEGQQFREYGSSPEVIVTMEESCAPCHEGVYDTKESIREVMDGRRGWDDEPEFSGRAMQHTFRLDDEGRVIGLPEEEWPEENNWPWLIE